MVNWKESQISKGLATFGYKEEVKILQTPSTDSQIRYVPYKQLIIWFLEHSSYFLCYNTILLFLESGKRKLGSDEISGMVVIAGDAFTESNFEGCLRSAKAAAVAIGENYKTKWFTWLILSCSCSLNFTDMNTVVVSIRDISLLLLQ